MNPTASTIRDMPSVNAPPEGMILLSQPTPGNSSDHILAETSPSANIQIRVTQDVDASLTSPILAVDGFSAVRSSPPDSSQDVGAVAVKVLRERQCTIKGTLCVDVAECTGFPGPARLPMEGLYCDDAAPSANPLFPPPRSFSGSENENPCSPRALKDDVVESVPTPRAPMKPAPVRSLSTSFPGKTRRRLDFDHV